MKITICGYNRINKRVLSSLSSFVRREIVTILGEEPKEVRIIGFKHSGFTGNEWLEQFDIYDKGVIRLRLPLYSRKDAKYAQGWAVHELYHARQQSEKRLVRRSRRHWSVLDFQGANDVEPRRYYFVGSYWNEKQKAVTGQWVDEQEKFYTGSKAIPWEAENFKWMKKHYPDLLKVILR